jgi:hypothetical protein
MQPLDWTKIALEGIEIAFDKDGLVKKNLTQKDKNKAKQLIQKSIELYDVDEAWPYIKLADLLDNDLEKFKLYLKSLEFEETIYALRFILNFLTKNNKDILNPKKYQS